MSFWNLELDTVLIEKIHHDNEYWIFDFQGELLKTMEGANQRTRWHQSGTMRLHAPKTDLSLPSSFPLKLTGGELIDNIYVHRNSLRVPLHSFGNIELQLSWQDCKQPLHLHADEITITLYGSPKYITHAR